MSLNFNDLLQMNYILGYFTRNKKIFTLSISLFILFALIGSSLYDVEDITGETTVDMTNTLKLDDNIFSDKTHDKINYKDPYSEEFYISNIEENYNENTDTNEESMDKIVHNLFSDYSFEGFLNLFLYNLVIDFECLFGGLFLSIPSVIITFINACQIGIIFTDVDYILVLFGVIPHGIFEIPSSVFAFSGALMLTSFELKLLKGVFSSKTSVKEEINNSIYLVKDALISAVIVSGLLLIAAFIETFITPLLLWFII